jgi:aspartokinase-like uncharacterized kinase
MTAGECLPRPLVVVKVGGSLLGSPRLDTVLGCIVGTRRSRLVVVPGGGPFADAVRAAQSRAAFDDGLAHRLALDAMSHMGEVLATRHPALVPSADLDAFPDLHGRGLVPVWSPAALRAGHPDIAESWAVTSDSLALWLAMRIDADRLVLIKSVDTQAEIDHQALTDAGIVDAAFSGFAARYRGAILLAGPSLDACLADVLGVPAPAEHAA